MGDVTSRILYLSSASVEMAMIDASYIWRLHNSNV